MIAAAAILHESKYPHSYAFQSGERGVVTDFQEAWDVFETECRKRCRSSSVVSDWDATSG